MRGPDEAAYLAQTLTVRKFGPVKGIRVLVNRFCRESGEQVFPSPLRWGWIWLTALLGSRVVVILSVIAAIGVAYLTFGIGAALLTLTSPLLLTLGRRTLQDVTVCAVTLAALGFSLQGDLLPLVAAVFALAAIKEAAVLYAPALFAVALLKMGVLDAGLAIGSGLLAWLVVTRLIVGPRFFEVFEVSKTGQTNPYNIGYQKGAPHRLIVDLALVSPAVLVLATPSDLTLLMFVLLAVAAHTFSPVRNVRTILAVDIVLRVMVADVQPDWVIAVLCIVDALLVLTLRKVYDPVTSTLCEAFGMAPKRDH